MQHIKSSLLCPSTIFNCTKTITDVKSSQEITNWYYITAAMQRTRVGFALSLLPRCQFDTTVLPLATIQLCFISAVPISPTLLNMTPTHLLTLSMSPLSAHRVHRWDLPQPKMSGLQAFVRCQDICRIGICNISLYLCCAPNYCANLFANKYLASVCQSSQLTTQLQIADFKAWDDSFKTAKQFVVIIVVRRHKQGGWRLFQYMQTCTSMVL